MAATTALRWKRIFVACLASSALLIAIRKTDAIWFANVVPFALALDPLLGNKMLSNYMEILTHAYVWISIIGIGWFFLLKPSWPQAVVFAATYLLAYFVSYMHAVHIFGEGLGMALRGLIEYKANCK